LEIHNTFFARIYTFKTNYEKRLNLELQIVFLTKKKQENLNSSYSSQHFHNYNN